MPLLYSDSSDGHISKLDNAGGGFSGARDADEGDSIDTTSADLTTFTGVYQFGSRGGVPPYRIHRSFAFFDTSGITGTVTAAQFEIVGAGNASTDVDGSIIAVKSNAFGGDGNTVLKTIDFDAIPGWTDGASQEGNVTKYSTAFESTSGTWSNNSANVLAGTSDLRGAMQDENVVIVCFLDYTNDYLNVDPNTTVQRNLGARYNEASSAGQRIRINYTEVTEVTGGKITLLGGKTTLLEGKVTLG